ncbi:Polyphosphate:AMP phosphotransferase [Rubrivivax sp. A210]|uniref:polyphosphate:AMP phosphotransferase n=1 Tax=Rubrivivax sp. A210 TaxID=2772301 RepID=UPI0019199C11|nr:polyphosphate:AMP phosphotransferase [Rubrivivax sp. A210]CAD5374610.1 Polyphosphate:AMP phosphotransferase [Rubrivivax sp. A210]
MFESAEIGHKIAKEAYRLALPELRAALLQAQIELVQRKKTSVLLIISGQDGAGKGETINLLYEWMDPRFISTLAFSEPTEEEHDRPPMWRYWRSLPPRGRMGMFAGSWYSDPMRDRIEGRLSIKELDARAEQINRFEAMLVNEGALILKFWLHLTKSAQRKRLKALEADPRTAWRVTQWNWDRLESFDEAQETAGHVLRVTNTPWAPWAVVEASDDRYRELTVGRILLEALRQKLDCEERPQPPAAPLVRVDTDGRNLLTELDLSLVLAERPYEKELARWQGRLSELVRDPRFKDHAVVCAFEGADAAGKGGAIRRLCAALDARQYQVIPIAAPSEEERAQPHLWRFWRHIPRRGRLAIFDRTWYGRVLVERVEGYCSEADWQRAYTEINDFEHELTGAGVIVLKFWLQTSREEQLRRFREREEVAHKRFKITEDDWRNRDKWDAYQRAVCDMVDRTSTGDAPWTLVESNDKYFARVKILRTLCERIEAALQAGPHGMARADNDAAAKKRAGKPGKARPKKALGKQAARPARKSAGK